MNILVLNLHSQSWSIACGHRRWKGVFWSFCWFLTLCLVGNTFLEKTLEDVGVRSSLACNLVVVIVVTTFPVVGSAVETSHIEEKLYTAFAVIFQGHT